MAGLELLTAYVNLKVGQSTIQDDARRDLKGVEKSAADSGKRIGGSIGSGISGALKGAAGLLSAGAVGGFLKDSIAGARESNKVAAITENAIKATGGAAKISASQVADLAGAISKKTGIDDEAIQSGANLLLTFKNVRNEVGAGNDIFNQATAAAQDLSAAGFGSAEGAAKMLGKALNDPVKGMSALGRAGVTFTDAQKKQVEQMVRTGDVLGAQKIIMGEVESQVGGAAEASATAGDKARIAFGNLQETVGSKLLPVIDKGAEKLTGFITGMEDGTGAGGKFKDILDKVWSAGEDVVGFLDKYQDIIVPVSAGILGIVGAMKAWSIASGIAAAAQGLLNTVMAANPIGVVVLALVGLTAGLVTAYKKSETFREIVDGAFKAVSEAGKWMWNEVLLPVFRSLVDGFFWVADKILAGAEKAFGWVPGIGDKLKGARKKFSEFKDSINDSLQRIEDKEVNVGIKFKPGDKLYYQAKKMGIATGGHIPAGVRFADGGTMPGYTPGRDVHTFFSPTAGILELSGGEPVLRPEAGRVLGRQWVDDINAAARTGGTGGVRRFLGAFAGGGLIPRAWVPPYSTVDRGIGVESLRSIGNAVEKLKASGFVFGGPTIRGNIAGLVPEFLARLSAWNQAAGGEYWVNSGYRSIAHQWALWNASDKTGRMVAYPGKSRHNFGTAADLAPGTTVGDRALARMFGLSFPMSYEPWHIQMLKAGGHVKPIRPLLFDRGGHLPPGISVVRNDTGRPEPLARTDQGMGLEQMETLLSAMVAEVRRKFDDLTLEVDGREMGRLQRRNGLAYG